MVNNLLWKTLLTIIFDRSKLFRRKSRLCTRYMPICLKSKGGIIFFGFIYDIYSVFSTKSRFFFLRALKIRIFFSFLLLSSSCESLFFDVRISHIVYVVVIVVVRIVL